MAQGAWDGIQYPPVVRGNIIIRTLAPTMPTEECIRRAHPMSVPPTHVPKKPGVETRPQEIMLVSANVLSLDAH
eukprot:8534279-Alexandrium_andersonii.AAC.1